MKIFLLKENWTEVYNDPDEGSVEIGRFSRTVKASKDSEKIQKLVDNLNAGFRGHWTLKRSKELKAIDPDFQDRPHWEKSFYSCEELTLV